MLFHGSGENECTGPAPLDIFLHISYRKLFIALPSNFALNLPYNLQAGRNPYSVQETIVQYLIVQHVSISTKS